MKKWLIFFTAFALLVGVSFGSYLYVYRTDFAASYLSRLFSSKAQVENILWHKNSIEITDIKLDSLTYSASIEMPILEQLALFFGHRPVIIHKLSVHHSNLEQNSALTKLIEQAQSHQSRSSSRTFIIEEILVNDKEFTGVRYPATSDQIVLAIAKASIPK